VPKTALPVIGPVTASVTGTDCAVITQIRTDNYRLGLLPTAAEIALALS